MQSAGDLGSATAGALALTSQQIYQSRGAGFMLYNDEPIVSQNSNALHNVSAPEFGHSKGIVGWSAGDNAGFWIVHSFPKYPSKIASNYQGVPAGEQVYAQVRCHIDTLGHLHFRLSVALLELQSVLCVSTDAAGLAVIGAQLQLNHPDV